MSAPAIVHDLVARFHAHLARYKQVTYNEEQLRVEFLNPLFEALGWDLSNKQGYAAAYKEVIHEDALRVSGVTKAPDYAFRIGGQRKFFLEAKKPSVNIKDDIHPAYQLRRYAWSAKLPLSILSDFEEFAVYDCRIKPDKGDAASTARVMYLRYTDFLERWDEIAGVFAKESILKGSFDQYAESHKAKRGTAEVDVAFLEEIERWRDLLARNIALRNPGLSQRDLNFAVQQTIDRIIFLRICEDRGIEPYGELMGLQNGTQVYARLVQKFRQADGRYNSGLFHFEQEKGQAGAPDLLTPDLTIDDKTLKEILKNLYYPDSPYEFSVLPADILGQVYERFLGKVIRLTAGHQAKVEEKPEVRKAGGVFYTPTYIVDYIVRQTVSRLVADKRPGPRGGVSDLRILDMACGSGSFLIGAYQFLLDWHLQQYLADGLEKWAKKHNPQLYQTQHGDWRLTLDERKRILLNNIYGVDIDGQAVEVTKLSLLLKLLEGEDRQTLAPQLELFAERILPDLDKNIRCGNALIGPEFYDGQMALLDEEEAYRINIFDWQAAFPSVMAGGGFDAVIGNPPYIRIQTMKEWAPLEVEVYKRRYRAASQGNYDIYVVFVEKGLSLLNERGRLGFILPHKFFNSQYGAPLRTLIAEGQHLEEVVHFGDQQVFAGATTYTCLLFLNKQPQADFRFVQARELTAWRSGNSAPVGKIAAPENSGTDWTFRIGGLSDVSLKLQRMPTKLGTIATRMAQGIRTSANEVYVLDLVSDLGDTIEVRSKHLDSVVVLEKGLLKEFLQGREIKAYQLLHSGKLLILPYKMEQGHVGLIPEAELATKFPRTYAYFKANKKYLEQREKGRMTGPNWYGYVYPKNIEIMAFSKILVPDIADRAAFAFDTDGVYAFTSGYAVTLHESVRERYEYILGLLNSRLLSSYLKYISSPMRGGFFRYFTQYIEQLPIRTIDFADPADAARHARMVALVERMLDLHKRLAAAKSPPEQQMLRTQIDATDRQIDRLVYELYGLSEEEIGIVEGVEIISG